MEISTLKQYSSALILWRDFASKNNINLYNAKPVEIIQFLNERFTNGASFETLNSYRSAINLISCLNIGKDELISRYLRGDYKEKPSKPKYSSTWDTTPVLEYLKTIYLLKEHNHKLMAEKVATLLALATAHRLQTLALIRTENIVVSESGIRIKIPDRIKTSKPGRCQPELSLPFFKERKKVCVATSVLEYLDYTRNLRSKDNSKLLISTIKPHKDVTAQTIGHWIKSVMKKSGIDTEVFSAYSTKHAAVSSAYAKGVNIDTIRRTAGWSDKSQTFANFYNRPINPADETFAHTVLEKRIFAVCNLSYFLSFSLFYTDSRKYKIQ